MTQKNTMPQDSRFTATLLAFTGGGLDVFSHMHFDSLLATQTGNIVLLMADLKPDNWQRTLIKLVSITFFSIGFVLAIYWKEKAKDAYWRTWHLLPLLLLTIILPFFPAHAFLWVAGLAFGTGLMMLTFTGSQIENSPFTILMTSGNYRKMLASWYHYFRGKRLDSGLKRQAINYSIVVASFILGAFSVAVLDRFFEEKTLWLVAASLASIIGHYTLSVHRNHLKDSNL